MSPPVGELNPLKNRPYDYNFTITWRWNTDVNWKMNVSPNPPNTEYTGTLPGPRGTVDVTGNTFQFPRAGAYDICVNATNVQQTGSDGPVCTTINVACRGNGQGASSAAQCCGGLWYSGSTCVFPTANINGTVTLIESDTSPRLVSGAIVNLTGDDGSTYETTTNTGFYEFIGVNSANYTIEVTYLDSFYNFTNFEALPGENYTVDLNISEIQYFADCTNSLGRCDRDAFGKNGCLMPGEPNRTAKRQTLHACDPLGSAGRSPGDLVFVEENATHRREALCCAEQGDWVPAPRAQIDGDVNNLIKYTRLTTYLGQPVRLVIATWN